MGVMCKDALYFTVTNYSLFLANDLLNNSRLAFEISWIFSLSGFVATGKGFSSEGASSLRSIASCEAPQVAVVDT